MLFDDARGSRDADLMKHTPLLICLGALLPLLAGCATSRGGAAGADPIVLQSAALEALDPQTLAIFDGLDGAPMTWSELVERAAEADVVIIGEMHGHPTGLAAAAALFDEILARESSGAALSLEFFERDEQTALDDYLTGVTDEDAFRKAARRTSGNFPPGHAAMVVAARSAGAPVFAANAPRRYVRLARLEGYDRLRELTIEQRRLFEIPQSLPTGRYRDRFFELMGGMSGHGEDEDETLTAEEREAKAREKEEMITSFFRSQELWDATMAATIADALSLGRRPVVHVVGQFHSDFEGGLLVRLHDLQPGALILAVSMVDTNEPRMRDKDQGRADVLIHVGSN